jgi:hypothetical protein
LIQQNDIEQKYSQQNDIPQKYSAQNDIQQKYSQQNDTQQNSIQQNDIQQYKNAIEWHSAETLSTEWHCQNAYHKNRTQQHSEKHLAGLHSPEWHSQEHKTRQFLQNFDENKNISYNIVFCYVSFCQVPLCWMSWRHGSSQRERKRGIALKGTQYIFWLP